MVNLQLSFQLANVSSVLYPLISTRQISKLRVAKTCELQGLYLPKVFVKEGLPYPL